jgi:hypothetical protein
LDLGGGNQNIVSIIRYCPRLNWNGRMVSGVFQGANTADFSDAVNLCTVGYAPPEGSLTTITLTNQTIFRYVRYLSPADGWCNVAEVQFYGGTNPPAPANVMASPDSNQIIISWNTTADATYNVMRSTNSGGPYVVIATNLSATAFTDFDLISGQVYYYVVQAMNPVGLMSMNSAEVNAVPNGTPSVPDGLRAWAGTNQTIELTWNATLNTSGYLVKRSLVSGGPYSAIASLTEPDFTDTGLANGVTYHYVVSAKNAQGESFNSSEVTATPGGIAAWIRAADPVGYWPLNEVVGTNAADISGNGLNGIYQPQVTLNAPGVPNPPYFGVPPGDSASSFNGQLNSWVSLPALNLNSASVTFTAWLYPTAIAQSGATGLIFCRDGLGTVSGFDYNPAGTQLGYTWNNDGGTYGWNSGLTPPAWQWSFVALVVTPTNATIYLYNTNNQTSARVIHAHAPSAFAGETRIGNDSYDSRRTFNGSLAHVAIYNRALAPNEIAALYQAGAGFFDDPALVNTWDGRQLTLSWPFGGSLLQATNLSGPWSTNLSAPPITIMPNQPQMFYRLK